jgi:hypothetical protein
VARLISYRHAVLVNNLLANGLQAYITFPNGNESPWKVGTRLSRFILNRKKH